MIPGATYSAHGASGEFPDAGTVASVQVADVQTLDQDGRSLRFASDVIADHLVVVNFIYTDCKTLCPISSAIFARLQELLGENSRAYDARLISITLDPVYDTPTRLKTYSRQYEVGARWIWITGSEENIGTLTRGLGASTDNFRQHESLILVGDARNSRWTVFNVLPKPEILLAEIERLAAIREQTPAGR